MGRQGPGINSLLYCRQKATGYTLLAHYKQLKFNFAPFRDSLGGFDGNGTRFSFHENNRSLVGT